MSNLLCWLGLHSPNIKNIWHPSFDAPTVTALETIVICNTCSKTIAHDFMEIKDE